MGLLFRTDWDGIDNTNAKAKPIQFEIVRDVPIIRVKKGDFRSANFENFWFELSPSQEKLENYNSETPENTRKINVVCLWYGRFPKRNRYAQITVEGEYELKMADGEEVVRDIGE